MASELTILGLYKRPVAYGSHGEAVFWAPDQWGSVYVRRLIYGCDRWIEQPWVFCLMTDTPSVLCAVDSCRLRDGHRIEAVPLNGPGLGWWCKVGFFREHVSSGRCFYSDLDNVLGGPCDEMVSLPLSRERPIVMLDDRVYPGMANGSTMLFDADHPTIRSLWTEYEANPKQVEREFSTWPHASDQAFVANRIRKAGHTIPYFQDLLPKGAILNSRVELERGVDASQCRFVYGSYEPKPHVSKHPWYKQHWTDHQPMQREVA